MKKILLFILINFFGQGLVYAGTALKPFFTDGCTMFADGTKAEPTLWRQCCEEHDLRYWFGGSSADMDATDLKLKACVNKLAGSSWANIIYYGVRSGHYSPIKNKTRWSWGWEVERENTPLTRAEIKLVIEELRHLTYDQKIIEAFIKANFEHYEEL